MFPTHLPLPIPVPVARGVPGLGNPHPWSVLQWIPGEPASAGTIGDLATFAVDLAAFLVALRGVDATTGPAAGTHNFFRGGPLEIYAGETLRAVDTLGGAVPRVAALAVWEAAMATTWRADPVWVHGDVAAGNLLVRDGRLAAVIDFGSSGVGDPACDTVIAWTLLSGASRAFRAALRVDVLDDPAQVADAVAVRVGEAARVDLVDHPALPVVLPGHRAPRSPSGLVLRCAARDRPFCRDRLSRLSTVVDRRACVSSVDGSSPDARERRSLCRGVGVRHDPR